MSKNIHVRTHRLRETRIAEHLVDEQRHHVERRLVGVRRHIDERE